MQKRILRKVICEREIARELAQEIAHLRLMPANEFSIRLCILMCQHPGDKFIIVDTGCSWICANRIYSFRVPNLHMMR